MKIQTHSHGSKPNNPQHVSEYVQDQIGKTFQNNGALEVVQEEITNTQRAFGRLVNVLAEKGILNAQDILNIVEDYSTAELIPE